MFDSKPYDIKYVQKSSPQMSEDFLFAEIYKFFTDKKIKYILRAEYFSEDVFAVKYYAAYQRKLSNKYNLKTNFGNAHKIILTCGSLLPQLLEKYPTASFAINGACNVDPLNNLSEKHYKNQRYRIYSFFVDLKVGRQTFQHFVFDEVSSYLLVNKSEGMGITEKKEKIKELFINLYNFQHEI